MLSKYNKAPIIKISTDEVVIKGYSNILNELQDFNKIAIECYPGTDYTNLKQNLINNFTEHQIIFIDEYANKDLFPEIKKNLTDDRVFGKMSHHKIQEFYGELNFNAEKYVVFGFGASLVENDVLIMADLARWEIQQRLRSGMTNWLLDNSSEDILRKYKRGFFFEWRMADKVKIANMDKFNYFLDLNNINNAKLVDAKYIREGLDKACDTPFRLVPFFDPGVWGGQWMKEKFNLDASKENYAWSFDGVPEENSLLLEIGSEVVEIPAMNLVKYNPKKLLGEKVYARFGDEFPIRFDLLDTIKGQNLSLQVHPLTEYIQENFGLNYTQDESYYILDVDKEADPCVYLGVKHDTNIDDMFEALQDAQDNGTNFDAEKYVNKIDIKKHDHVLIPAGTVHCSGAGTMVLEISATPYIFTFKLWDWGRLGTDGLPRPVHLEHGKKVIQMDRDLEFCQKNLVNNFHEISDIETKTGLYESQFIETRRFKTSESVTHQTHKNLQMLNLVSGSKVIVSSPKKLFDEYVVNYTETFIIPANVEEYTITPIDGEEVMYIKAFVRF